MTNKEFLINFQNDENDDDYLYIMTAAVSVPVCHKKLLFFKMASNHNKAQLSPPASNGVLYLYLYVCLFVDCIFIFIC